MKNFIEEFKDFCNYLDKKEQRILMVIPFIIFALIIFPITLQIIYRSESDKIINKPVQQEMVSQEIPVSNKNEPTSQSITINTNPTPTIEELESNSSFGFKQEININGANSTVTVNNYKNKE